MKFKPFQVEDYAAAAMSDGLVLAHDTGLGKSLAAVTWPLLKLGFEVGDTAAAKSQGMIRVKGSVLIVAPGDLHDQLKAEFKKFFGIVPTSIQDQAGLSELVQYSPTTSGARAHVPPGFYITSYTRLAVNGVKKISAIAKLGPEVAIGEMRLNLSDLNFFYLNRAVIFRDEYATMGLRPDCTQKQLDSARSVKIRSAQRERSGNGAICDQICAEVDRCHGILSNFVASFEPEEYGKAGAKTKFIWRKLIEAKTDEYGAGIGELRPLYPEPEKPDGEDEEYESEASESMPVAHPPLSHLIKCVYSPSMADLCSHLFDCVVIDEGVKMKGADTAVGRGIRQMCPKYRLVLTATPVKNRLPDIFFLAWWAAGGHAEATARWPYAGGADEQDKFAETFMLSEFNKSKADKSGTNQKARFTKLRPEICNLHLLWKLLAPVTLRRRKQDIGQAIVQKIRHVYRVPMGLHQRAVYRYHLESHYLDCNMRPAPGAKLQALRVASAAPDSHLLDPQPGGDCRDCCDKPEFPPPAPRGKGLAETFKLVTDSVCRNCGSPPLTHRSQFSFTPKVACALTLIRDILRRREQVAVFSAFNDPSDILSRYLTRAGVGHHILDGRTNQAKRGLRSAAFNRGEYPVTLAGADSMAEGHNWDNINNIILTSYTWAADKIIQAINRAHRLTSRKDVNLYVIICDQSADRVLEDNINEKTNSSELAIDGRLLGESSEEKSVGELLREAMADFRSEQDCPNEENLALTWPILRAELEEAADGTKPVPAAVPVVPPATPPNICHPLDLAAVVFPPPVVSISKVLIEIAKMDTPQTLSFTESTKPILPSWRRIRCAA